MGIQHALVLRPMHPPWQSVLPALVRSAMLVLWLVALLRLYNQVAERNLAGVLLRGKIGNDLFLLLKNIIRVVIAAAGLLWLFAIWQIDLTPLFASAGIAGIAVALAAKETLANFFGGISIFADNTFKVGDYIVLETGERGEVVEIGIRSTRIKTRDDYLITIPNSILANSKIINESAPIPRFRIRVPVGVAYGSDLDQVEAVLLKVAGENENIAPEPQPLVRLRGFGDSSVNFELLCWVADPSTKGLEMHNLLKAVYQAFAAESITIPFPQREVHMVGSRNALSLQSSS
jgi:small-conductance mechanosensitive channel